MCVTETDPFWQILLARRIGKKRIIAETGAGQHGVATATVCAKFGLECIIYMGAEDARRQELNVFRMQMLGAAVSHLIFPYLDPHEFSTRLSVSPRARRPSKMPSMRPCVTG